MDWEKCYQEAKHPWDLGEPAPPLMSFLEKKQLSFLPHDSALVPGCGFGHDAEALRKAGLEVTGLDISPTALEIAENLHGKKVKWQQGDFLDPQQAPKTPVDLIFEHTCFCAIDPDLRSSYVRSVRRWLVPFGRFVGIFFTDPPPREDGESGPPYRTTIAEVHRLFGQFFKISKELSPDRSHPDRLGREVIIGMVRNP